MKKNYLTLLLCGLLLASCSSIQTVKHLQCMSYSVSGDNVEWKPTKFYQAPTEGKLYIQLPSFTNFQPDLYVKDVEFDRPAGIQYTYNPSTHTYRVDDNYDEYILSRIDLDTTYTDEVYIKCNREVPIAISNESESKEK